MSAIGECFIKSTIKTMFKLFTVLPCRFFVIKSHGQIVNDAHLLQTLGTLLGLRIGILREVQAQFPGLKWIGLDSLHGVMGLPKQSLQEGRLTVNKAIRGQRRWILFAVD